MKYLNSACIVLLLMASCSSNNNKSVNKDSVDSHAADTGKVTGPATSSLCFLRTEGTSHQDSTTIELVIKDNKLTGEMNWQPYQKDSRKGTLDGTVKGDTINAVWTFMQEGMKDTIGVKFLLKKDALLQKPMKVNTKNGREETDEAAGYTVTHEPYNKVKH